MIELLTPIVGNSIIALFILFFLASAITVFAAMKLAYFGDAIAETTELGHSLVGLILLSAATSLPELFSSSSAAFIGNFDLSFGNVFGSNMTNIFILVIMDFFVRKRPILYDASQKNIMTGGIVMVITCCTLLMLHIATGGKITDVDFWFFSPILFCFYVGGMIIIYRFEKANLEETEKEQEIYTGMTKQRAIMGFLFASIIVFISSILLSYTCNQISEIKIQGAKLGGTFVGTLFMAFTTSLPEIVVSIAAIKIGSHDMALGNLFGSNLFNLAILSFTDGFYRFGKLFNNQPVGKDAFSSADSNHLITGIIGLIFVGIVLSSLMLRKAKKSGPLGVDTLTIGILYFLGLYLLYILR